MNTTESKKTIKRYFFERLKELNLLKNHDEMAELMLELQSYLIEKGYLTNELRKTSSSYRTESAKEIVTIFVSVRNEYQPYEHECEDFSYISVAFDWLEINNIQPA